MVSSSTKNDSMIRIPLERMNLFLMIFKNSSTLESLHVPEANIGIQRGSCNNAHVCNRKQIHDGLSMLNFYICLSLLIIISLTNVSKFIFLSLKVLDLMISMHLSINTTCKKSINAIFSTPFNTHLNVGSRGLILKSVV